MNEKGNAKLAFLFLQKKEKIFLYPLEKNGNICYTIYCRVRVYVFVLAMGSLMKGVCKYDAKRAVRVD